MFFYAKLYILYSLLNFRLHCLQLSVIKLQTLQKLQTEPCELLPWQRNQVFTMQNYKYCRPYVNVVRSAEFETCRFVSEIVVTKSNYECKCKMYRNRTQCLFTFTNTQSMLMVKNNSKLLQVESQHSALVTNVCS